MTSQFKYL